MAGTKAGGQKAAATNKAKYGADFYARIGSDGGKVGKTGGFYHMKVTGQRDKIVAAGRAGGSVSKRGKSKPRHRKTGRVWDVTPGAANG